MDLPLLHAFLVVSRASARSAERRSGVFVAGVFGVSPAAGVVDAAGVVGASGRALTAACNVPEVANTRRREPQMLPQVLARRVGWTDSTSVYIKIGESTGNVSQGTSPAFVSTKYPVSSNVSQGTSPAFLPLSIQYHRCVPPTGGGRKPRSPICYQLIDADIPVYVYLKIYLFTYLL